MPDRVDIKHDFLDMLKDEKNDSKNPHESMAQRFGSDPDQQHEPPYLQPRLPPLPPHLLAAELFGQHIITDTLTGNPTIAGITAILQTFLTNIHAMEVQHKSSTAHEVIDAYFAVIESDLAPFERAYRSRPIFDIREDDTIFMSLGAYRDHLLGATLKEAFKNAKYPSKLFIGAVVQNVSAMFSMSIFCH